MTTESRRHNEDTIEKHTRLALKMLEDARQEIAAGDLTQGGEKLWGATSQALKAYCEGHGLPHGRYHHRRQALLDLAERLDNPFIRSTFGLAQACHGQLLQRLAGTGRPGNLPARYSGVGAYHPGRQSELS